jgi:V/A-type H+/Na+-transporting ATPase subunit C
MKQRLSKTTKSIKSKVKVKSNPYTYVRTSVMKSMLLKKEDYDKLLKMGFNEIARFLESSTYKSDIDFYANKHLGIDLLEHALNKNVSSTIQKLRRISNNNLKKLIDVFVIRKDVDDIKTIIRGKFTGESNETIINQLYGAGTLKLDYLVELTKMESIEEILKKNQVFSFENLKNALKHFKEEKNLIHIENILDKLYYHKLIEFTKNISIDSKLFSEIILLEIEIKNIITLLKFKKEKVQDREVILNMIHSTNSFDSCINKMVHAKDNKEMLNFVQSKSYYQVLKLGIQKYHETGSLIEIELLLTKFLLEKSRTLMHKHPLSVDVVLNFLFAKEIEIRNLKLLIKSKELNLDEKFVTEQLVI